MDKRVVRKLANAFMPSVEPRVRLGAIDRARRRMGGLWVGGVVDLSAEGVRFRANQLNAAMHDALAPVWIPAGDIASVTSQFGWLTGIVLVQHGRGEFRFRCFGARRLAAYYAAIIGTLDEASAKGAE